MVREENAWNWDWGTTALPDEEVKDKSLKCHIWDKGTDSQSRDGQRDERRASSILWQVAAKISKNRVGMEVKKFTFLLCFCLIKWNHGKVKIKQTLYDVLNE